MSYRLQSRYLASLATLLVLGLAGCRTVTDQMTPDASLGVPAAEGPFLRADGTEAPVPPVAQGEGWWRIHQDPVLDSLMGRLMEANPDLTAAAARVDQSLAVLGITRSSRFPTIRGNASAGRELNSVNNLLFPIATPEYSRYQLGMSATWEVDLWGRVRAMAKRDTLRAEAEAANYEAALLSLQATLAEQYFTWRAARAELALRRESVQLLEGRLELEQARLDSGLGVASDVAAVRLDLLRARAGVETSERTAGKLLHALATLTGVMPSRLTALAEGPAGTPSRAPVAPAGLPSDLLARRPDLVAADRQLQAAAQQIGIRRADFLPKITLVGSGGLASLNAENLFETQSGLFSIGPQIDIPLVQAGARRSAVAQAQAQWREAVAVYRGAFLTAVREVDDALLDVHGLDRELAVQAEAVQAAVETAEDALARREAGLVSDFERLAAEQTRIQAHLTETVLQGQRRIAGVHLIQALGGGWGGAPEN